VGGHFLYTQKVYVLVYMHSKIPSLTLPCSNEIGINLTALRRVWRYQRGNHKPYIEEEQTTQWPKEKVQKDKQRSKKHTYKTKDRVTRTPLKTVGGLRCSGRV